MLDRAARAYMNHLRAVRIVGNELVLSKVYSWYAVVFAARPLCCITSPVTLRQFWKPR